MKTFSVLALALATTAALASGTTYSLTSIGDLPGFDFSSGYGLNDHGEVAGLSYRNNNGGQQGFRWSQAGGIQALPGLTGTYDSALGINNAGNIVGDSYNADNHDRATLWTPDNTPHTLGVPGGGVHSVAIAINNRDEAVGYTVGIPNTNYVASIFSYGFAEETMGLLPGGNSSFAYSINDNGLAVGEANIGTNEFKAFMWTRSNGMVALPTLGTDNESSAADVNLSGQIIGNSFENLVSNYHPWIYTTTGGLQSLGAFNGNIDTQIKAINDSGTVVGASGGGTTPYHGVTWTQAGGYVDLNTQLDPSLTGWTITSAVNINASGQILAYGEYNLNGNYAYVPVLLTPNAAPVPEPTSLAALGLGAVALLRRRKKA